MMTTTKQAESYSTVPHSISSHPVADNASPVLPPSTTTIHNTDKNIGPSSFVFPVIASVSDHTQPSIKERSQVTDDDSQQQNAGANITRDTISE